MGFLSHFSWGQRDDLLLALDIGTEVVKAIVFQIDRETRTGRVIGVGRTAQRVGNMQSGAVSDIHGVIQSAREAIDLAKARARIKRVEKSIIGIAGELVKGTTTTVHYERVNSELKIGLQELKMIIGKVQEKAYERIKKQLAWETDQPDIEVKLINAALVDTRIDGYRVINPFNFQGKDVSMSVFNAYAPMIHLGALQTIADELDLDLLSIVAEPYAVARSVEIEDMFDFSAIFIDIGGGTTDIAVVRNGGLEGTKMFALGGRAFTKRVANEYGIKYELAEQMKLDYSAKRLKPIDQERISALFTDDCRVWLGGVELSLMEFAETDFLPSKIYLCGGGSALPEIKQALLSQDWYKHLPFSKPLEIGFLQPKDIQRIEDTTGELLTPQDVTPLGLAHLALVEALEEEKMLTGILQESMHSLEHR